MYDLYQNGLHTGFSLPEGNTMALHYPDQEEGAT
jgi:hypothetical protein